MVYKLEQTICFSILTN